jgi:hypothetical protein
MGFTDPIVPSPNWEPTDNRPGRSPYEDEEDEEFIETEEEEE